MFTVFGTHVDPLTQAMVGGLFTASDARTAVSNDCGLSAGLSSCTVNISAYATTGQSIRIGWTCVCGVGDNPTVDPISGACTTCPAGAATALGWGSVKVQVGLHDLCSVRSGLIRGEVAEGSGRGSGSIRVSPWEG